MSVVSGAFSAIITVIIRAVRAVKHLLGSSLSFGPFGALEYFTLR
jgi:hypothetical protein